MCPAGGKAREGSASTSRLESQPEFQQRVHVTYDHFRDLKKGSCEEALTETPTGRHWQPQLSLRIRSKG